MPTTAYTNVSQLISNLLPSGSPAGITADNHRTVELALLAFAESQWVTGDIKEIDCTQQYILDNFEQTGPNKGKGLVGTPREGWAICNGLNGTKNRTGRVSVAWGDVTPLGATGDASTFPNISPAGNPTSTTPVIGGDKDAVLVSHAHSLFTAENRSQPNIALNAGEPVARRASSSGDNDYHMQKTGASLLPTVGTSSTEGVSGDDKNMQPYIVTLFIQKISV